MDLIYECPECGSRTVGPPEWKQFCSNHEVTETLDGSSRRIVEMTPVGSINA